MTDMTKAELLRLTPGELTDLGICPTCFNRENGGALFGSMEDKLVYADDEIECFFVENPRAEGHMCIASVPHYHDMSEAPDALNAKMIRYAKCLMLLLREEYGCERVYLCTMCDGPNNHYHLQLIPRYPHEKRGSGNFVKPRGTYVRNETAFHKIRERLRTL